jgi:hypothetical protein
MNPLDIDVRKTAREVVDRDAMNFRFERGVRTADAAQLTAVDDVKMQRVDMLRLEGCHRVLRSVGGRRRRRAGP